MGSGVLSHGQATPRGFDNGKRTDLGQHALNGFLASTRPSSTAAGVTMLAI